MPYCFSRSSVKFQGHAGQKLFRFWPELSVSRLQLQFEFIHGFEMTHKAWCSIEEVPYCFPRLSIKFQGHRGQQIANYDPKWAFPDCNFSLNSPMNLKAWCNIEEVTYYFFKVTHPISTSHWMKNRRFESNLSKITRPVAIIKFLRFALFFIV